MDIATKETVAIAITISVIVIVLASFAIWKTQSSSAIDSSQNQLDKSVLIERSI